MHIPIPSISEACKKLCKPVLLLLLSLLVLNQAALAQQTVDNASLQTWWHANYEINSTTPVAQEKVRRSSFYDVQVSTLAAPDTAYDSFVYMSIPRSGKGKPGYDGEEDGAEFVAGKLTMSWSSFLYSEAAWVTVSLREGTISSVDEVVIRPTRLNFEKVLVDNKTVRIKVPYASSGYRFSVEFAAQLYTAYNDMSGNTAGKLTDVGGGNHRAIHTEPRNSLLIFAEPILTGDEMNRTQPDAADGSIYYPEPGETRNLNNINEDIIYFRPGTYYMGWNYHALLNENVKWVYFAPGAYVKGAIRFPATMQTHYKVTGYGVLSGEQYIYEADTKNGYNHLNQSNSDCHTSCVKMLQFESDNDQQTLDLQGVTINEPPYHSFVVYGNENTFKMRVNNYKQVGSWVWQTDGIELYTGSTMKDTFFHANDDVLKMYHSNVSVDNTTIWKGENGPVIQWGWDNHRNLDNIVVTNTDVIHNRVYWRDVKGNTCIINSAPHYAGGGSNGSNFIRGLRIENTRVEGMTNCAIRIYSLISMGDNAVQIKNLHIDEWNKLDPGSQVNHFQKVGDVFIGTNALSIENFKVGNEYVTTENNNTGANQPGRFDFKLSNWKAVQTVADCKPQTITFPAIPDRPLGSNVILDATASSGLPVSYSVSGGAAMLVNGTVDVGNTAGEITVKALQAGTAGADGFCPVSLSRVFFAGERPPQSLWLGASFNAWSLAPMRFNASSKSYELEARLDPGNYEMKFANSADWSGDDWGRGNGLQSTVVKTTGERDSNSTFTITETDEYTIHFDFAGLKYSISSEAPVTPDCTAQTINFAEIAGQQANSLLNLDARASSSLPVTFTVSGGNARIVDDTSLDVGDRQAVITVTATQAGNATFCPVSIARSFSVKGAIAAGLKAPLYWSPYEANIIPDAPLKEDEWKNNANWISEHYKKFGYDMIATDGWIEGATQTNDNGYILKYNDSWTMTWHDMGDYLEERGLAMGVYYNPFWITPAVVNDPSKKIVGTDISVSSLVDRDYRFPGENGDKLPGDRFGYMFGRSNDQTLYWVQADRPGAEAYVKGYIDYFAAAGMKYLRVDFLSWYEDGMDKGDLAGKPGRSREHYELMLKWMKEACDKHGIFLSLVMPHLKNEGALEVQYGHMIRINEDAGKDAGWGRWSELDRGNRRAHWSQWANAVDGFTYWSKLSGRGKMILDGDFIRLNTFGGDNERKSAVSLSLIAGGPVTIADRVNSIGDHGWVFQNEELLALNKDGFVGKPLSNDPSQAEAYTWTGQMSNGDWILGLFNRDADAKPVAVNFADLGMGESQVRDLWEHKDLGVMDSFNTVIPGRGVVVLRLAPASCDLSPQTISFSAIPDKDTSVDPLQFDLDATASSGLPVTLSVVGPATLSGTTISLDETGGTVSVTASQPGNSEFCAAAPVTRSFEVTGGIAHQDTMFVGASFNQWRPGDLPMTLDAGVWTVNNVRITAGEHRLKFANSGTWEGDDWGQATGLSGTAVMATGGAADIEFSIAKTGNYTITFDDLSLAYAIIEETCEMSCEAGPLASGETYIITAKASGKVLDVSEASSANGAGVHQWEYLGKANQQWRLEDAGDGLYYLVASHSGKLLDIQEGSTTEGAYAHQWEQAGVASQRWTLEPAGENYFFMVNHHSGKALTMTGGDNGMPLQQGSRDASDNFLWSFTPE
ncbi:MAG: Dextranase [Cellvibrio sp.]|nr:Dextranase [Cellvibrio sp.]